MDNFITSAMILPVSKNNTFVEEIRQVLEIEGRFRLSDKVDAVNLQQAVEETKPDMIFIDFNTIKQPYYWVYKASTEFPTCSVVAILYKSKKEKPERAIQAGAQAFVQFPQKVEDFLSTCKGLLESKIPPQKIVPSVHEDVPDQVSNITLPDPSPPPGNNGSGSPHPAPKQVVSPPALDKQPEDTFDADSYALEPDDKSNRTWIVFSPRGGAGCTTVATNLAISLYQHLEEDVLLIDGKHLFGHVALFLNMITGNSIYDLHVHAGMLDEQLIRQVVVKHESGILVLPSPHTIEDAQSIQPEQLFMVLQSLQQVIPNIIIDGGNALNDNTVTYMDASDKILLVLNPDLASMKDVKQFLELSSSLSYPDKKILLILNKVGKKSFVDKNQITKTLGKEIFGTIPEDEEKILSCLNEGVPMMVKYPRHAISKMFAQIASDLLTKIQADQEKYY